MADGHGVLDAHRIPSRTRRGAQCAVAAFPGEGRAPRAGAADRPRPQHGRQRRGPSAHGAPDPDQPRDRLQQQLDALQAAYDSDKVDFFFVLDAQRRFAEAESQYYQSRVEYALALRNVNYEKGTLLAYCGVSLGEGPWPTKAYVDAARRDQQRLYPLRTDYRLNRPRIVSLGPFAQGEGSMPSPTSGDNLESPEAIPAPEPDPAPEAPTPLPADNTSASDAG